MPDPPEPKRTYRPKNAGARKSIRTAPQHRLRYAELHAKTSFSFLEGASHPDELVERAAELGYEALAITDRNSLAGVVRAHLAAKDLGVKLLIGAEITPVDAVPVVLLSSDRASYGLLVRLITLGRRAAPKGQCRLTFDDVAAHAQGLLACVSATGDLASLCAYREAFRDRCYALAELHRGPNDQHLLQAMIEAAKKARLPLVAANDVHYHVPSRR
jgi:error-prone DNA polymerase